MDGWIRKIESGERFTQKRISDEDFRRITSRYHKANDERQRLYNKNIKTLFYRKDSNMLLPVTNGRVGGLAQRVKRRKQKKREDRLRRTEHCPEPLDERNNWNDRFYVKADKPSAPYTGKTWTKVRPISAVNQVRAIANETMNFDGNADRGSIDSIFHYMDKTEGDEIEVNGDIDDEDPFGTVALATRDLGRETEAVRLDSPQVAQKEGQNDEEKQLSISVGEDMYGEDDFEHGSDKPPRSLPKPKDLSLEFLRTMSSQEVLVLLKKLGFQHYIKQTAEMGVTGKDLASSNEFDLNLMGFTYRPHRMRLLEFLDKKRGKADTIRVEFEVSQIVKAPLEDPSATHRFITKRELAQVVKRMEGQVEKGAEPEAVEAQVVDEAELERIELEKIEKEKLEKSIIERYHSARRSLLTFVDRLTKEVDQPAGPQKSGKGLFSREAPLLEESLASVRNHAQLEIRELMDNVDREMKADRERGMLEAEVMLRGRKERQLEEFERMREAAQQKAELLLQKSMGPRYEEITRDSEEMLKTRTSAEEERERRAKEEALEEAKLREEEGAMQSKKELLQKQQESAAIKLQCLQRMRTSRKTVMVKREHAKARANQEAEQAIKLRREEEELRLQAMDTEGDELTKVAEKSYREKEERGPQEEIIEYKRNWEEDSLVQEEEAKRQEQLQRMEVAVMAQAELDRLSKQQEAAAVKLQSVQRARMSRRIAKGKLEEARGLAKQEKVKKTTEHDNLKCEQEKIIAEEELVVLQQLQEAAAIKLQSLQRARLSRKMSIAIRREAQTKGLVDMQLLQEKKVREKVQEEESLALIEVEEIKKLREDAAIKLQCAQRARISRKSFTTKREEKQRRESQRKQEEKFAEFEKLRLEQEQAKAEAELEQLQKLQERAATKLQSIQRGRIARGSIQFRTKQLRAQAEEAERLKQAHIAEKIRREEEERLAQAEFEQLQKLRERAATKLQSLQRAHSSRKLVIAKREENKSLEEEERRAEAATKLQCLQRIYAARKATKALRKVEEQRVEEKRLRMEEEEELRMLVELEQLKKLQEEAATKVQALQRGRVSRKVMMAKLEQKTLEEVERKKQCRTRETELEELQKLQAAAVTKLQSLQRGRISRKIVISKRKTAKTSVEQAQSAEELRLNEAKNTTAELEQLQKLQEAAATKLQSIQRAIVSRKKVAARRLEVAKLEEDLEAERKFAEEAEKYRQEAERLRLEDSLNSIEDQPPVNTPAKVIKKTSVVTVSVKVEAPRSSGNGCSSQDLLAQASDPTRSPSSANINSSYDSRDDDDHSYSSYTRSSYSSYSYYSDNSDSEYDSRGERYGQDRDEHAGPSPRRSPKGESNHHHHVHHKHHGEPLTAENTGDFHHKGRHVHGHHRGDRDKTLREQTNGPNPQHADPDEYTEGPEKGLRTGLASAESSITMGDIPSTEPSRQALGGGWERIDEGDTTFYFNAATNEVRTSPPRL